MKVLVTGGAGFIGSHLVDALLDRGDDVVVLDNLRTGKADNVSSDASLIVGDINDEAVLAESIANAALVFHLAAVSSVQNSVDDPVFTDRTNSLGTLSVLMAAAKAGTRRVVIASSSSVYGPTSILPTPESAPTNPQSPYAASKLAAEAHARVAFSLHGIEAVALRYFNVFGPRQDRSSQYSAVIPLFIDALAAGEVVNIFGDGQQSRDFVFIDDVVQANLLAAQAPFISSGSVFNVGRGEQHTLLQLIHAIADILGVSPVTAFHNKRQGDIHSSWADISAATKELHYEARVTLEEGLKLTIADTKK